MVAQEHDSALLDGVGALQHVLLASQNIGQVDTEVEDIALSNEHSVEAIDETIDVDEQDDEDRLESLKDLPHS